MVRSPRPLCLILGLFLVTYSTGCSGTDLSSLVSNLGLNVDNGVGADANRTGDFNIGNIDNSSVAHDGSDDNNDDADSDDNGADDRGNNEGHHDGINDNGTNDGEDDQGNHDQGNAGDNDGDESGSGNANPNGLVGDTAAGATVFNGNNCVGCHGTDGSGPPNILGEDYASLDKRARSGQNHPGGAFPDLTDQDLADIQAFLSQ